MSNPKNRFRIDQVLWNEAGQELARYSVAAETFEQALMSSQLLIAPHLECGLITQVVRIGFWCETHKCYHDASERLAAFSEDGSLADHEPVVGPNGPN